MILTPLSTRAAPVDVRAASVPDAVPNTDPNADPAGFSSLLRQTQLDSLRSTAPEPVQPARPAATPTPAPARMQPTGRATSLDKSPAPPDASTRTAPPSSDVATEPGDAPPSDAPQPATARPAGRRSGDPATPARPAAKGNGTAPHEATPPTATDERAPTEPPAGKTGAALDPALLQALAAAQRQATASGGAAGTTNAAPADGAGLPSGADPRLGAGADAAGRTEADAGPVGGIAASTDATRLGIGIGFATQLAVESAPGRRERDGDGPDLNAPAAEAQAAAALAATNATADTGPTAAPATSATTTTATSLQAGIDSPEFAHELGLRMSVLVEDGVQHAELQLNPAEMGPVSVRIALDGTQARIDFGADVAATRQAIESGLPQLASALRDAGFTLAGGGVSEQRSGSAGSGGSDAREGGGRRRLVAVGSASAGNVEAVAQRIVRQGGVDLFA